MGTSGIRLRKIAPADHRQMPWKNGLGTTAEIAVEPPDSGFAGGRFDWRLSIATVERSSPFSAFPGYERTIMVIEGAGMELTVSGRRPRRLDRLFDPFVFSGDDPVDCRLLGGPIRDFNLMVDRARLRSRIEVLHLADTSRALAPSGRTLILHCLSGGLNLGSIPDVDHLTAEHTLVIDDHTRELGQIQLTAAGPAVAAAITLDANDSRE